MKLLSKNQTIDLYNSLYIRCNTHLYATHSFALAIDPIEKSSDRKLLDELDKLGFKKYLKNENLFSS